MEKMAQALEKALEELLGQTNLPSRYPDFQALTRDLVRKLADKVVLVDRKTWNEVSRSVDYDVNSLEKATARFKSHNDRLEAAMSMRSSVLPPMIRESGNHARELADFEDSPPNIPTIEDRQYHNDSLPVYEKRARR